MPRKAAGLSTLKVRTAAPGRYGDGGGLYLLVKPPNDRKLAGGARDGGRFWLFRYLRSGKMREMGLGAAAGPGATSLADARAKARRLHDTVKAGRDPLADRQADAAAEKASAQQKQAHAKTFREVAALYLAAHEPAWRNQKHRWQWRQTLEANAYPHMGDLPVAEVGTTHVMAALEPIWQTKTETAARLRGRIESVLDYAKARGWRSGENPARWRGHVANMLPRLSKGQRVKHLAALPWGDMGAFVARLRGELGMAARALEFTILTAGRTGEVLGARWDEIDLEGGLWNIPAARMKAGREHRVPLSVAAMGLVTALLPMRDADFEDWVFHGAKRGHPLSNMAMLMLLRRMGHGDITAHGFRSTFRDWAAESTPFEREVVEMALAHSIGDKVEAAYRRGDLMEKRRRLMESWAVFCDGSTGIAAVRPLGSGMLR
jgi:integrase